MHSSRGWQASRITILIVTIIALSLSIYMVQDANAYSPPPWKWVLLPSCTVNETMIGIRAYITPFPYPGAINDKLVIEILNPGSLEQNLTIHVYLPSSWAPRSVNRTLALAHGLTRIVINGVNIPPDTRPGTATVALVLERICGTGSAWKTIYLPLTIHHKPKLQVKLVNTRWSDGYAYPGIRSETLIIELRNDEPYYITSYRATILLSEGLSLSSTNTTTFSITRYNENVEPGGILRLEVPIDVAYNTSAGNKTIYIRLKASLAYEDTQVELSTSIPVRVRITSIPELQYRLLQQGWLAGAAYPGEKGAILLLDLVNIDKFVITDAYIVIKLPKGISSLGKEERVVTLGNSAIGYGKQLSLELSTDISDKIKPGIYYVTINAILYGNEASGARGLRKLALKIPLQILPKASMNLKLLYFNWSDGYAYPGEINTALRMILRSLDKSAISNIVINITFPKLGITRIIVANQVLRFGDILETTPRITLPRGIRSGDYRVNVILKGIISINGQEYLGVANFTTHLTIDKPETSSLRIVTAKWKSAAIANKTFFATPEIILEYWGSDRIDAMTITIYNVSNARLRGNISKEVIIYRQPLAAGEPVLTTLPQLRVINPLRPVSLTIAINATLDTPSGGTYAVQHVERIALPVAIEGNELRIASTEYVTKHLLPGARDAEINIRIANTGPEPIYILGITPLSKDFNITVLQSDCLTTPIAPGSACTLALSLAIPGSLKPGTYMLSLWAWYSYQRGSDTITSYQILRTDILVENLEAYRPKLRLYTSWAPALGTEPITVLPGDVAPLQITIYNEGPTTAKGIVVEVNASKVGRVLETTQPCSVLPAGSSCTILSYIEISNSTQPGYYTIPIRITYIFDSYTVYKVIQQNHNVSVEIGNDKDSIKLFYLYWLTPPRPGTRSAQLAIYLVENPRLVSEIRTVKILLPSGFFNPETNSSKVVALPAESVISTTQLRELYEISSKLLKTTPLGNIPLKQAFFIAKIGIGKNLYGVHKAILVIYWVDKLGTLKTVSYEVTLPNVGGSNYIKVIAPSTTVLRGGIANISLRIMNVGNMPLYNVYISLIPTSYTAYPRVSTRYIPEMLPGREYVVNYSLNYNPSSFGSQSSYTFNGIVSILYEDPTGLHGYYNTSVSIILRPSIKLELTSLKAAWSNGSLIVEGVVANTGTEQAKTVSIEIQAGNKSSETLIGDIDAGSESPFRLSLKTRFISRVTIKLTYHDSYGLSYSLTRALSVEKLVSTPIPHKESKAGIVEALKRATVLLVIAAILSIFYLYRRIKRLHSMEGSS